MSYCTSCLTPQAPQQALPMDADHLTRPQDQTNRSYALLMPELTPINAISVLECLSQPTRTMTAY